MKFYDPFRLKFLVHANKHWSTLQYPEFTNIHKHQLSHMFGNFVSASIYRFIGDENITRKIMKTNYPKVKENYTKVTRYCHKHSSGKSPIE